MSYISGEFHGSVGPLFNPHLSAEVRKFFLDRVALKLKYINDTLIGDKEYVLGSSPSVADYYLYIILTWHPYTGFEFSSFPNIVAFFDRVQNLEVVQKAKALAATAPTSTA